MLDSELCKDDFSTMLILLRRKAREVSKFHSPSLRIIISGKLGDVGDSGSLVVG